MGESSLSITYAQLRQDVAFFLGWTRTLANWSTDQKSQLDEVVRSGLRQFYIPPSLIPGADPHEWTFLRPVTTITTVASDADQDITTDDFGGIIGGFTYATDDGYDDIAIVGEGNIRSLRQRSDSTGKPQIAAIRPKTVATGATEGQRFEVMWFPSPDAAYVLTYQYFIYPEMLSSSRTYPYGGMAHAETIKESCLAIAEETFETVEGNIHQLKYKERLAASISRDKKMITAQRLPMMRDTSDQRVVRPPRNHSVTYNGVLYEGD